VKRFIDYSIILQRPLSDAGITIITKEIMNHRTIFKHLIVITIGCAALLSFFPAVAADSDATVPPVIDRGFQMWAKQDNASYAIDVWKKGGLLDEDKKPTQLANYFSRIDRTLGNYRSYELISAKPVNQSSQIVYIAINFNRASVYARFLLYRPDKNWIVQNMDFSTKPEAVMPWLAFEDVNYAQ
jgi:hypothetical protein